MKKIKLAFLALAVGFVALLFVQNQPFLLKAEQLRVNFYLPGLQYEYTSISNAMLLAGAFVIGFLIAYFLSLTNRYRSGKTIKNLNAVVAGQQEEIQTLKSELDQLKTPVMPAPPMEAEEVQPVPETRNPDAG